ncbi:DUF927 domain-containing protein [Enterobacter sp. Lyrl_3]|uniref:DUF927 domain-containing protein n=1 Tax=Enterobacter sp. Lyrl_3 TaxID=3110922 RepID=UPI003F7F3C7C
MKLAPNVKQLPKDKFTEAVIFAGSDAYAHAKAWEDDYGKKIAGDTVPPIRLGSGHLSNLENYQIIDTGRRCARVYIAGEIEPILINAIAEKLALAGVQDAKLYKGIPDRQPEDWRDYLSRLREQAERGESLVAEVSRGQGKNEHKDDLAPCVEVRKDGLYWVTPKIDGRSGEVTRPGEWLCDPIRTVGVGHDGGGAYFVIEMKPVDSGKIIHEALPRNEIGMAAGWARLRGRGVSITTSSHLLNKLAEYLQRHGERTAWEVTSTAGWHCGAYVMPDGEVIGIPERPVAFCGGSAAVKGYVVRGTAEEWRDNVASLMRGNHSMMLGTLVGLAAPLNSLAGGSCFGVHLFAQSSSGKTTTVEAATSLYGDPEMLKLSWDATKYGLTVEAASRNDGFVPIDEIGQGGDVKAISQSAYSLFNGVGRIQGRKDGGNRASMRWKIAALSTGEEDFETFLIKGGITPKAGQLVRLLSVPFTDTTDFNGYDDGDEHARAIKRLSSGYCGAAGREWVRWLAVNKEIAINTTIEKENMWLGRLPEGASAQVRRVASRFAMLDAAGELAQQITGWMPEECQAATKQAFDDWLQDFGLENREKHQIVSRARDFLQRYALNRFQPYTFGKLNGNIDNSHAARIQNLAGYAVSNKRDDGQLEYHIIQSVFDEEILDGISRNVGCQALFDAGMLIKYEPDRWPSKTLKINNHQQRFIVLIDPPED